MRAQIAVLTIAAALAGCGGSGDAGGSGGAGGGASTGAGDSLTEARQTCVDKINSLRASIGVPPYAEWTAAETCTDGQAQADAASMTPHSAFGQCGEFAQDECPGWPGPPASMIGACMDQMWAEGPGSDFATHGHYINMSSTTYTMVSCGFSTQSDGSVWATQDFK
jgi:Cysteine-rich secretory protein family